MRTVNRISSKVVFINKREEHGQELKLEGTGDAEKSKI
jgi:hypothetical protein